jgi:hypothetical protein
MLAEVGEFFINMTADIGPVHNPDLEIATLIHFFNVGWLQRCGHHSLSNTICLSRLPLFEE